MADALTARLVRYGAQQASGRDDQPSHAMLANEVKEQQVLGTVLPSIFLGVAAFLLNVVVARLVATQREQIAALKALGYTNFAIARHYLQLVLFIVGRGHGARRVRRRPPGHDVHRAVCRVLLLPDV